MAVGDGSFVDEDGDFSDWIEIYNPTDTPVDLNGWYLTDDANNLTQWSFPDMTLAANDHLLVFASDKDRRIATEPLHTNFKLTGDGEYLLEDGEDIGRFLRIEAVQSFLKPQAMASRVYLKEVYLNGFAQQDVTAHPTTFQFVVYSVTMKNYSPHTLKKLLIWVDPDSDVSISSTALGPWSNPKTEAAGTSFPDLVSGGTDLLYLRVGVSAASNAYAKILNHIHARYYAPF